MKLISTIIFSVLFLIGLAGWIYTAFIWPNTVLLDQHTSWCTSMATPEPLIPALFWVVLMVIGIAGLIATVIFPLPHAEPVIEKEITCPFCGHKFKEEK